MTSKHSEPDDSRYDDETLLDGKATLRRYSPPDRPKSHMWLKRRQQTDPNFPKPIYIGIYPFFRLGALRRWEDGLPTAPPAAQVALGKQGVEVLKEARRRKKEPQDPPPADDE